MTRSFGLTYDYRCPYARIAHDHVIAGLRAGADWDVTFLPFSLARPTSTRVSRRCGSGPRSDTGPARPAGIDRRPRHPTRALPRRPPRPVRAPPRRRHLRAPTTDPVLAAGVDVDAVWAEVDSGRRWPPSRRSTPPSSSRTTSGACRRSSSATPAVFVRLLDLPDGDGQLAVGDRSSGSSTRSSGRSSTSSSTRRSRADR